MKQLTLENPSTIFDKYEAIVLSNSDLEKFCTPTAEEKAPEDWNIYLFFRPEKVKEFQTLGQTLYPDIATAITRYLHYNWGWYINTANPSIFFEPMYQGAKTSDKDKDSIFIYPAVKNTLGIDAPELSVFYYTLR